MFSQCENSRADCLRPHAGKYLVVRPNPHPRPLHRPYFRCGSHSNCSRTPVNEMRTAAATRLATRKPAAERASGEARMSPAQASPGDWDGLVVLCAANGYDGIKLSDWHVAKHLSRLTPVLYVDPPMSRLASVRNPRSRRRVGWSTAACTGPGPGPTYPRRAAVPIQARG